MRNYDIAKILHEIAVFEKAALYIGSLEEELVTIYKKGGFNSLMELPGIGKGIVE